MTSTPPQSYPALRSSIRSLENDLSSHLSEYSHFAAKISTSYSSSGSVDESSLQECKKLQDTVEQELDKLSDMINSMRNLFSSETINVTTAMRHTLTRHEEVLSDHIKDFRRTQNSLEESSARASLLTSIRSEISQFKAASTQQDSSDDPNAPFLAERDRIDSSHRMADDILGQAYETRNEFLRQKDILNSAKTRMSGVISTLPSLNSVMTMIRSRRRRDNMIIGSLMALCTLFLLWYITR